MRRAILLGSLAALAGCAYPDPQRVAALNALVGKPEVDVIRTQGVPSRTYEAGGDRFLAYSESRIDTIPGTFGGGFYGWGGWGGPWFGPAWGGTSPEIVSRQCETTFELAHGIVQRWSVKGNDC